MIDGKPLLDSSQLDWGHISLSAWHNVIPQESYISCLPQNLIVINKTLEPFNTYVRCDGRDYERIVNAGHIDIFAAQNLDYFRWEETRASICLLSLSPSLIEQIAFQADITAAGKVEFMTKLTVQDSKIIQLCEWLLEDIKCNGGMGKLYIDSVTNLLVLHVLQTYMSAAAKQPVLPGKLSKQQLSRALEYIHSHSDINISLEDLAEAVGLSQSHLIRMFKQTTGLSPYQYLIHARIEKAKTLIKSGEHKTMGEIAAVLGFADQSHMNRHFKRITGLSPREFLLS